MQGLASRLWSPTSRFHPGQLAWSRYFRPVDPHALADDEAIAVWTEAGETLGFGWAEAPDWLELQVDPARPDVAEEVIEWFEEVSDAETQSALVMEGDVAEQALAAAGFAPQPDEPFFTHHSLDLAGLPPVPSVPGYRLRHVEPHDTRGKPRVDDRRVISGILHVLKSGCRWCDCPPEYGPPTTIYNRFVRWSRLGVFNKIFAELALRPRGLVLVTGPTGSGKSTTLAAMVDDIESAAKRS